MNQLVGTKEDGTHFLMLVLEPANLHRLQKQDPVLLRIEDWFPDGIPSKLELVISYSETPVADARGFKQMAHTSFDERTARSKEKKPHCPECRSTIEQLGMGKYPALEGLSIFFCPVCGCTLGAQVKEG